MKLPRQKPSKIKPITIVLLLITITSIFGIPGCMKQDPDHLGCILCYKSNLTEFGGCAGMDYSRNCEITGITSGSSLNCVKCREGYVLDQSGGCFRRSDNLALPDCKSQYTTSNSKNGDLRCRECSGGYPKADYTGCIKRSDSCEVGHRYPEGYGSKTINSS